MCVTSDQFKLLNWVGRLFDVSRDSRQPLSPSPQTKRSEPSISRGRRSSSGFARPIPAPGVDGAHAWCRPITSNPRPGVGVELADSDSRDWRRFRRARLFSYASHPIRGQKCFLSRCTVRANKSLRAQLGGMQSLASVLGCDPCPRKRPLFAAPDPDAYSKAHPLR